MRVESLGTLQFAEPGAGGIRPFSLRLAQLDVPHPRLPSTDPGDTPLVLDSEAVRRFGAGLKGQPVRIALSGREHWDTLLAADGSTRRVRARSFGHVTHQQVTRDGDGLFWDVFGEYWPDEDPEITDYLAANQEQFGGSYELGNPQIEEIDGTRYVREIDPRGLALLERSAAAFMGLTRLLMASAKRALTRGEGEAQGLAIELLAAAGELPLAAVAGPSPDEAARSLREAGECAGFAAFVGGEGPEHGRLPYAAMIDGRPQVVRELCAAALESLSDCADLDDAQREAAGELLRYQLRRWGDGEAEPGASSEASGREDPPRADSTTRGLNMENELLTRLEAQARENADLTRQLGEARDQLRQRDEAAAAEQKLLEASGAGSVEALLDGAAERERALTEQVAERDAKIAELEAALVGQSDALEAAGKQIAETKRDSLLAQFKAAGVVTAENEAQVAEICRKVAVGEPTNESDLVLLASAKRVEAVEGEDPPAGKAPGGQTKSRVELILEAQAKAREAGLDGGRFWAAADAAAKGGS